MSLAPYSHLLFIGDSITDAFRSPTGEGVPWEPHYGLGVGYVSMVNSLLFALYPELTLRVTNKGCSGNTMRDVEERWEVDVLDHRPDLVFLMIGVNDAWRHFDIPGRPEFRYVQLEEYQERLKRVVSLSQEQGSAVLLLSPFFVEPNPEDPLRQKLDQYTQTMREVAEATEAIFVDVQYSFDRALVHRHSTFIAGDRIHPHPFGHMLIAKTVIAALQGRFLPPRGFAE